MNTELIIYVESIIEHYEECLEESRGTELEDFFRGKLEAYEDILYRITSY